MKTKNSCVGRKGVKTISDMIRYRLFPEQFKCKSVAKIFENEKWYCKRHAPSEIKKREDKSWNNYIKRIQKNYERSEN